MFSFNSETIRIWAPVKIRLVIFLWRTRTVPLTNEPNQLQTVGQGERTDVWRVEGFIGCDAWREKFRREVMLSWVPTILTFPAFTLFFLGGNRVLPVGSVCWYLKMVSRTSPSLLKSPIEWVIGCAPLCGAFGSFYYF